MQCPIVARLLLLIESGPLMLRITSKNYGCAEGGRAESGHMNSTIQENENDSAGPYKDASHMNSQVKNESRTDFGGIGFVVVMGIMAMYVT